ncbi:MAG: hypothetical protein Q8W51_09770 [Candidatus Palauibacterales bacterium]|nr:hypothetical protein [Candidatus Palauibacterales bacterium]MDP2530017.1 hypothetical protein [Candidatus Palauibacterales bacterium]MDP2585016.1 hypothetical protein [Candidatus Palauibacterales bacterium]
MEEALDRLHARARRVPALRRLAIVSRILLALAFIPTGTVKLLGHRFTSLGVDTRVGAYFEAMYRTAFYWNFIGAGQVVAGILLLIPVASLLGAVVAFPIVLNIFVITVAVGFRGTPFVTGPMLLAVTFLLCWDWDRLKPILFEPRARPALSPYPPLPTVERAGYALGTLAGLGLLWRARFPEAALVIWLCLGAGAVAVLLVLTGWIQAARRSVTPAVPEPPTG